MHMHRAIDNLIHLRYLGLRDTGLWKREKLCFHQSTACLPESIGKLKNLYTIDLRVNSYARLPKVLWKLENLRHLLVGWGTRIGGSIGLGSLRQLETLKTVKGKSLLIRKDDVAELPNLRNLGVEFTTEEEVEIILKSHSIFGEGSHHLRSLKMMMRNEISFSKLELLSKKLPSLRFLSLEDKAYSGSKMICSARGFPKLEILTLKWMENVEEWLFQKKKT